jgi:hypothetical protein
VTDSEAHHSGSTVVVRPSLNQGVQRHVYAQWRGMDIQGRAREGDEKSQKI